MPAMTNLLLRRDSAATDQTFYPVKDIPFPEWRTNTDGIASDGQAKIQVQWQEGKTETKVNVKIAMPIMEIIPAGSVDATGRTAAPKVAGVDSVSMTFFLSNRGTQNTRAELIRAAAHLMCGANSTAGTEIPPVTGAVNAFKGATSSAALPYAIVNRLFPGA